MACTRAENVTDAASTKDWDVDTTAAVACPLGRSAGAAVTAAANSRATDEH